MKGWEVYAQGWGCSSWTHEDDLCDLLDLYWHDRLRFYVTDPLEETDPHGFQVVRIVDLVAPPRQPAPVLCWNACPGMSLLLFALAEYDDVQPGPTSLDAAEGIDRQGLLELRCGGLENLPRV